MKIKTMLTTLAIAALSIATTQAQELMKTNQSIDLAFGYGPSVYSGAVQYVRTHGIGQNNKFRLGYGVRLSAFSGTNLMYITAPASLTANDATIDSLSVASALTLGLSAVIHIQYQFNHKFLVGFNIDAVGVGFGPEIEGTFISANRGSFPEGQSASPTSLNVLLVGDNDIGHLKSEFYAAYAITEKIWLRAGLDMTFSEYTTNQVLTNNNDRFRYKAMLFFVGGSYSF